MRSGIGLVLGGLLIRIVVLVLVEDLLVDLLGLVLVIDGDVVGVNCVVNVGNILWRLVLLTTLPLCLGVVIDRSEFWRLLGFLRFLIRILRLVGALILRIWLGLLDRHVVHGESILNGGSLHVGLLHH